MFNWNNVEIGNSDLLFEKMFNLNFIPETKGQNSGNKQLYC